MSIVIAGAGSVGLLLGSYLVESGLKVTMLVRREEQAEMLKRNGICRINEDGSELSFSVEATTQIAELRGSALWIIAVKYSDLPGLLAQLKASHVTDPLLFVQNGIGHVALANATDSQDIAFATVEHGALQKNDRTVSHNGVGVVTIGNGRGDDTKFDLIEEAQQAKFPVARHYDAEHVLLRKVLINCMINPLTAILEVENGELLTNASCYELFINLYDELMDAFPAMREYLTLEQVAGVCENTAKNRSSMLADRSAGRPMEIETIVTAVVEKANASKKMVPLLSTFEKMLYALEGKEKER